MDIDVADEVSLLWEKEEIPDDHLLYMRVHRTHIKNGDLIPRAFRNLPTPQDGMSTDWFKYSSPEETRQRARVPSDNAIIEMVVGEVRKIPEQIVEHTPSCEFNNRAHTDVFGEKSAEARVKFWRISRIILPLDS